MVRWIVVLAAILGAAGVFVGSFAAHGLGQFLASQSLAPDAIAKKISQCEVGVRYHLWHAITILVLGAISHQYTSRLRNAAAIAMVLGVLLFSGGLYSMSILGITGHWSIVPSGGAMLILSWLLIAGFGLTTRRPDNDIDAQV